MSTLSKSAQVSKVQLIRFFTNRNDDSLTLRSAGQNLYFHLNHPIKWIRLVGVIVALDIFPTRWILILDDSSGATIEITCGLPKPKYSTLLKEDLNGLAKTFAILDTPTEGTTATGRSIGLRGIDVGTAVKLKGGIGSFRGEKQVLLERISIVHTTNEEIATWAENTAFRRDILDHPWVVSEHDEKRAKRKAEGLDRERKVRDERKRRKLPAHGDPKRAAAHNGKRKREEDKRKREEERRKQEERRRAAVEKEEQRIEEAKCITAEEEKSRDEEAKRANAGMETRERDKNRREQERKIREQEYGKLMRQKELGKQELGSR